MARFNKAEAQAIRRAFGALEALAQYDERGRYMIEQSLLEERRDGRRGLVALAVLVIVAESSLEATMAGREITASSLYGFADGCRRIACMAAGIYAKYTRQNVIDNSYGRALEAFLEAAPEASAANRSATNRALEALGVSV
jgi:hypothetical protein